MGAKHSFGHSILRIQSAGALKVWLGGFRVIAGVPDLPQDQVGFKAIG